MCDVQGVTSAGAPWRAARYHVRRATQPLSAKGARRTGSHSALQVLQVPWEKNIKSPGARVPTGL